MKIGFVSLGCPKNLVDGEVMLGMAQQAGHEITPEATEADVLVVNTCAFIDSAKQESIDTILEMAQQKRDGRCARLVVTGCLAERYRDELVKEIPEIDAVLGTGEVAGFVDAIDGRDAIGGRTERRWPFHRRGVTAAASSTIRHPSPDFRHPPSDIRTLPTYIYDAETPRLLTTPRHFAYIKIAEGCDYTCAFCIIPTLRGHYRSRTRESIVPRRGRWPPRSSRAAAHLAGHHLLRDRPRGARRARRVCCARSTRSTACEWIRLLYLYPTTITDDVSAAMAECDKVCRYVDLPLQHASAAVLKRMRRPGQPRDLRHAARRGSATAFPASQ